MEGAINDIIDKENPKVVNVVPVSEIKGKKAVYCRWYTISMSPFDASLLLLSLPLINRRSLRFAPCSLQLEEQGFSCVRC